jgi:hypothetical protein
VRDVLSDAERAEEIEDESLEDYAERSKIRITNPPRRRAVIMPAGKTGNSGFVVGRRAPSSAACDNFEDARP